MDLKTFFTKHPAGALAFSGGTDSSLLAWAAMEYGETWHAYYVHTAFQPAFELKDAHAVAAQCRIPMTILEVDILQDRQVVANPADRCYFCKQRIFSLIQQQAAADGFQLLIDGTNASDEEGDRPGMRALRELQVRSPLRECGLTKAEVRALCRKADLFVWDKPAYACLATRIPTGTPITRIALAQVEQGESILFSLGFRDFRLRLRDGAAVLQVPEEQFSRVWELRDIIRAKLSPIFSQVVLDLTPRPASR